MNQIKARHLAPVVCLLAMALAACGTLDEESKGEEKADASSASVTIDDFKFSPQELKVAVDTKVTWTNKDKVDHTVTAEGGQFDQLLKPGDKWSYTFKKKGTFKYTDRINTQSSLDAKVVVE